VWPPRAPWAPARFAPIAGLTPLAIIRAIRTTPTTPSRIRIMPAPLEVVAPVSRDRQREPVERGHLHLATHAPAVDRRHDLRQLVGWIRGEDEPLTGAPPIETPATI